MCVCAPLYPVGVFFVSLHEVHAHVHVFVVLESKAHVDDECVVQGLEDLAFPEHIPDGIHFDDLRLGDILESIHFAGFTPLHHADLRSNNKTLKLVCMFGSRSKAFLFVSLV